MAKQRWADIPVERLSATTSRQVIHTEKMTVAKLHLAKGATVPVHHHQNEQFTTLESGRLRFDLDGREIILEAGDILPIPPGVPHGVEALEDTIAVDFFTPPREDWIRGDDAYLRR